MTRCDAAAASASAHGTAAAEARLGSSVAGTEHELGAEQLMAPVTVDVETRIHGDVPVGFRCYVLVLPSA